MKVSELIKELQRFPLENEVEVGVKSCTQVYPSCYISPHGVDNYIKGTTRIAVTLPGGHAISVRRKSMKS